MPRLMAAAAAGRPTARVLWLASASADAMSTTDGAESLYTAALLRILRERDPPSYEAAQAAVREALTAHAQRVPEIAYFGGGGGRFTGRPFTP